MPDFLCRTYGQEALNAKGEGSATALQVNLVHEFRNASLLAVSPDGKLACLYFTKHPQDSFTWRGGLWKHENDGNSNEMLRVTELSSWKSVRSEQLRQKVFLASFFAGGQQLYVETQAFRNGAALDSQQLVIDLRNGKTQEHVRLEHPDESFTYYYALQDRVLLASKADGKSRRTEELILAKLPDYTEIAHTPFPVSSHRDPLGHDTDVFICANRKMFVYGTGRSIVCRKTEDLAITWIRQIEQNYWGTSRLAISADGSQVAVAIMDYIMKERQPRNYVGVYGLDGTRIARLPVDGTAGLAVSPNGKLLAVGERTGVPKTQETQLAVSIIDIASGKQVAHFIHDQFRVGRGEWVNSHFLINGIQFTADGKYLITSSIHTKVWELQGVS
jgi:hypothetical protein